MPEFIGLQRLRSRARRKQDQKLDAAAASVERQAFEGPRDMYYPAIEGRLNNDDKVVEKQQARKLDRRRAFVRRGHVGRLRARILGMRLLAARVRRTAEHLAECVAEHDLISGEWSAWKEQMGISAIIGVVPRLIILALTTVGAVAETMFSSGAAEVLVGTTGVVPGWAELPLSLTLAGLFGLGTLLLTKWGIEEGMLVQFFMSRRPGDRLSDAPWAGRSPFGRVIRVLVAAGAVALIIGFSAHLRGSAADIKAAASAQPVHSSQALGAKGPKASSPVAGISDGEFLALGVGTALLMAAITLIAMDPARIHAKRLSSAERWARRRAGFWSRRHQVALRLLKITEDRDAAVVRKADLAMTGQYVTSSQILLDLAEKHPRLFGNEWPKWDGSRPLKDLGLAVNGKAHIPEPSDRFGPPVADFNGSAEDA
jgi:hypothetical protein